MGAASRACQTLVVPFKRPVYEGVIQEFEHFVLGT